MTKVLLSLAAIVFMSNCASKSTCADISEEPVSTCRAKNACGGVGTSLAIIFGGMGAGMSGQQNQAANNYNACIDNNLSAQRANAGVRSNNYKCETVKISDTESKTSCHEI